MGESPWAGGCREPTVGPAGRPGFGHQIRLFPSTFEIPMVVTGDGVTITICGNHRGALPHITEPRAVSLPVGGPGWAPQGSSSPTPRGQEPPPLRVPTSLRTSPLSPDGGTAPFRPTVPRMSSRTNTHSPGSDAELASPGAHTPQDGLSPEASTLTAEDGASVTLTDSETGRHES